MADNAIIYPDMVEAATWLTEAQREKFLAACTLYRSAGIEPEPPKTAGPGAVWYALFLACRGRFDASKAKAAAGRKGGQKKAENNSSKGQANG